MEAAKAIAAEEPATSLKGPMTMAKTMANNGRRDFLLQIGGLADSRRPERRGNPRSANALLMRQIAAVMQRQRTPESTITNGDEQLYPNQIASATKGLLHSQLGEVDLPSYQSLLTAVYSQKHSDAEAIILGYGRKLVDLEAGFAYDLEGGDSHTFTSAPPPAFASELAGVEMVELYWQAEARDVPFAQWNSDPIIGAAAAEMNSLAAYQGPRDASGQVTTANVFRGTSPGCTVGPYISQYLLQTINFGSTPWEQMYRTGMPGVNYLTAYSEWLLLQSGLPPYLSEQFDPEFRYVHTARNLAQHVHYDYIFQSLFQAALILCADYPETLSSTANVSRFSSSNPYRMSKVQSPYASFGPPLVQNWLGRVASLALKTIWHDKWAVHRRQRPESYAGRVYNALNGAAKYPIHPTLLNSKALQNTVSTTRGLLSQAYVEGAPLHPSYPAGHAVVAGACATLLKALFDGTEIVSNPVSASADGLSLIPYTDTALTIGGEINKLAFNVPMARNWAGIHWRTDGDMSRTIGEQVAICFLQDQVNCFTEPFPGFSFTGFDGKQVSIVPGGGAFTGMNNLAPGY
jgi:hypothetical protein